MTKPHTYRVIFRNAMTEENYITFVDVTRQMYDTLEDHRQKIVKLAFNKLKAQGIDENMLSWATTKVHHECVRNDDGRCQSY